MTVIDTETTTGTRIDLPGLTFSRALTNAALFTAHTKYNRPTIEHIRVSVSAGQVTLEATDSYVLYRETLDHDNEVACPFSFFVHRDTAKQVANMVKGWKVNPPLSIELGAGTATYSFAGQSVTVTVGEVDYPNTAQLRTADHAPTERFGLGADNLARIAKVKADDGQRSACGETVVFSRLNGELKPLTVTVGQHIDILVMPVRTN